MSSNDLYIHMLNSTSEKIDLIRDDIKEIKELLGNVKSEQAKCDSRWSTVTKLSAWLFSGLGLSGIVTVLSNWVGTHK